mmetsp:Transcript_61322/g.164702  ORF Transcript_61322/g.164702 Transcript_61322/m.164702 type:complete len:258 (+) Transcript_61322:328-1101(+)
MRRDRVPRWPEDSVQVRSCGLPRWHPLPRERPSPGCLQGRRAPPRGVLAHGLRRPRDRRALRRPHPRPLPPGAQRLRRPLDPHPAALRQLLLQEPAGARLAAAQVGRQLPVRGRADGQAHDAAHRHGPAHRPQVPRHRRGVCEGQRALLPRLRGRLRQAHVPRRPPPLQPLRPRARAQRQGRGERRVPRAGDARLRLPLQEGEGGGRRRHPRPRVHVGQVRAAQGGLLGPQRHDALPRARLQARPQRPGRVRGHGAA